MKENWNELIGKRILLRQKYLSTTSITEVTVVEVSESGKYVKFRWTSGSESWKEPEDEYSFSYDKLLEVLKHTVVPIKGEKPDITSNILTGKTESHDDNTSVPKPKIDSSSIK